MSCEKNGLRWQSPCRDATGRRGHVKEVVKKGSQNYKEIGWIMELGRDLMGGDGVPYG